VRVTIAASGRVTNALVTGDFTGTPEGSCMARTLRTVRFPPSSEASFTVTYPYRL